MWKYKTKCIHRRFMIVLTLEERWSRTGVEYKTKGQIYLESFISFIKNVNQVWKNVTNGSVWDNVCIILCFLIFHTFLHLKYVLQVKKNIQEKSSHSKAIHSMSDLQPCSDCKCYSWNSFILYCMKDVFAEYLLWVKCSGSCCKKSQIPSNMQMWT